MKITQEMKLEIERLARKTDVVNLKNGHFSKLYLIKDGDNGYFQFRFQKENENLKVIYNKNLKLVSYSLGKIGFYDNELKMNLSIDKSIFDKRCDEEVNFILSNEQKELLSEGKDITLEVTSVLSFKTNQVNSKSISDKLKVEHKNFVADFSFFLGKTSNLLIAKQQQNQKLSLSNISKKIE